MKLSESFFITRKEYPKDEESISAKLLVKSGMIIKNDSGIYTYLPIGLKVIKNIEKIIRSEMKKVKAEEVLMPSLINNEFFKLTNRDKLLEEEMYEVYDRNNRHYALCPTHEELFAYLAKAKIQSYKDLHFTLFQISNKFRDEAHPEYGLIRKKEFYMADAYSFDSNEGGLDVSYDKMYQAFTHIFNRIGLDTIIVRSDPLYMKGLSSEEFQIISENGDNIVVKCSNCAYTSNIEEATCKVSESIENTSLKKMELVKTPNARTIKDASYSLKINPNKIINSLVVKVDEKYLMILLRGESKLNFIKLKKVLKCNNIEIPSEQELEKIGTYPGFIGPIKSTMDIIADNEVKYLINAACGGNKLNYYYINVVPGRDFRVNRYADLKLFDETSKCPKCGRKCDIIKGIEVGHIFKLGDSYSQDYGLKYVDEKNTLGYVHMGSYGIGVDRCIGALVEKYHDDKGIIWPISVAPFKVGIAIVNVNDQYAYKYSMSLYDKLNEVGIEALIDDRKETIGTKFADLDLIGLPFRVTVGEKLEKEGLVELKLRDDENVRLIDYRDIIKEIQIILKEKEGIKYGK